MKRGEAWWVEFDPAVGGEIRKIGPAVIVSNDAANRNLARVVVVPFTSSVDRVYAEDRSREVGKLDTYIKIIVEPTAAEFERNPLSIRHAFLACVTIYHAIDRVAYPKSSGNLRRNWGMESKEFLMVDIVAHHFKHVKSNDERPTENAIPLSLAALGQTGLNTHVLNGVGQDAALRNLVFVVRDAVQFLYSKS